MVNSCSFHSLPIFPIPIGLYNFGEDNHELNKQLINDIITERKNDPDGEDHSNFGGWHSKVDLEKKYQSFNAFSEAINECGNHYCKTYGYKDGIICSDLWANMNTNGDFNFMHHHGTSALTGVYYPVESIVNSIPKFNYTEQNPIKAGTWDNKDGGALVFQDPSYGKKIHLLTDKPTPYNIDFYHVYPTSSVLVLFPTYLLHMVLPFKENKTRVSISFSFTYGKN